MGEIRTICGRGFVALFCSLLLALQPVIGAPDPSSVGGVGTSEEYQRNEALPLAMTTAGSMLFALSLFSTERPVDAPESIAIAKVTGTAERNGLPLLNGSIVASGDAVRINKDSGLLLTSNPQERLWLGPNTSAKLTKNAGNVAVSLEQGTLGFETRGHLRVTFEKHDGLALRCRPDTTVRAQLSLINNQEAKVQLLEGSLELVQGTQSVLLQPETSNRISSASSHSLNQPVTKKSLDTQAASAGQSKTGSITGTVVNSQLFVVSGASATMTTSTGETIEAISDTAGKFVFSNVPAGTYTLRVMHQGFETYELKDLVVRGGEDSALYVKLVGGGAASGKKNNSLLIWIIVGGAAAAGVAAAIAAHGSSSSSNSPH